MNVQGLYKILNDYLAVREAIGLKDRRHKAVLEDLLRHIARRPAPIAAQVVVDWACSTPHPEALASQAFRLRVARSVRAYVKTIDPETEIPPAGYLKTQRRRQPYLFSRDDIARLIDASGALGPRGSLRPHTYQTIIGLLAGTGLRASEAV